MTWHTLGGPARARAARSTSARRRARRRSPRSTPEADIGSYVIVHVGFSIAQVEETEAHRTLEVLRAMADAVEGELGATLPWQVPLRAGRRRRTRHGAQTFHLLGRGKDVECRPARCRPGR
ncbi:HypC/HybG/HupF family hydrogenase formation chaperone [Streptomyces sp. GLT-R25]